MNNRTTPVSIWRERDFLNGKVVDALVVILDGPGCAYAHSPGCTMCGYNRRSQGTPLSTGEMASQVRKVLDAFAGEPYLKVFTSGSFLDQREVSLLMVRGLLEGIHDRSKRTRLLVESRPEYISEASVGLLRSLHDDIEIAIGLETSSDRARRSLVQKGFSWGDYRKAGEIIVRSKLALKTYLILKPPFLGEYHALEDTFRSIMDVSNAFPESRISVNPINIQSGTPLEILFHKGLYRPPWLHTLLEVLRKGKASSPSSIHFMSSPTAGGRLRGVHNCGKCDATALSVIERFSLDNTSPLTMPDLGCCLERWKEHLMLSRTFPLGRL